MLGLGSVGALAAFSATSALAVLAGLKAVPRFLRWLSSRLGSSIGPPNPVPQLVGEGTSILDGAADCDMVGVLDIPAQGHAVGDARDLGP